MQEPTTAEKFSALSKVDLTETAEKMRQFGRAIGAATESVRTFTGSLPKSTSLTALAALNLSGKHIYGGTVPASVVATRRAANKVARRQRRVNRQRNFRKGVR